MEWHEQVAKNTMIAASKDSITSPFTALYLAHNLALTIKA